MDKCRSVYQPYPGLLLHCIFGPKPEDHSSIRISGTVEHHSPGHWWKDADEYKSPDGPISLVKPYKETYYHVYAYGESKGMAYNGGSRHLSAARSLFTRYANRGFRVEMFYRYRDTRPAWSGTQHQIYKKISG